MGDNEKVEVVEASKVLNGGRLFEQIYNPKEKKSTYITWDETKNEAYTVEYIEQGNIKYIPIHDELLDKNVVVLPSGVEEYESVKLLENEIDDHIFEWVDVSKEHRQKASWYVLLSWVVDRLYTVPYLRCMGDYGTGKTRYLDVIGGLCYKPMYVGGSVRSAPIYRIIDLWRGTAVFDEFTLKKSDESEDIIQILNNGFQRNKPVLRCASGDYDKVKAFDPFGTKILATRSGFQDRALESRCITEIMQSTVRKDVPIDLSEKYFDDRRRIQNKLLLYRFKNWRSINADDSIKVDFGSILPRIKQSMAPFTVLFYHNKERLADFIKYTQEYNRKIVEENSTSFDGQIFNAFLAILEKHDQEQQFLDDYHEPSITSTDIKNIMVEDGWKEDKLHAASIGRRLKALGFKTVPKKISGHTRKVLIVDDELLLSLKQKYTVTVVTAVTVDMGESQNSKLGDFNSGQQGGA